MFSALKNHPFAVEAFFESSLVLTFAAPADALRKFLPECFTLDIFDGQWAFIAVAMVQTKGLRPKGLTFVPGQDFFLAGYRIFVRYRNNAGKNLRGLYILKSETDKRQMQWLGNLFTHYKYNITDIRQRAQHGIHTISSVCSRFHVTFSPGDESSLLPAGSPFTEWKEARRFAGPLPFTFSYDARRKSILIVEGVREHWKPKPVIVLSCRFPFLDSLQLNGLVPASAFLVTDIPYYWKKGKTERWSG